MHAETACKKRQNHVQKLFHEQPTTHVSLAVTITLESELSAQECLLQGSQRKILSRHPMETTLWNSPGA